MLVTKYNHRVREITFKGSKEIRYKQRDKTRHNTYTIKLTITVFCCNALLELKMLIDRNVIDAD